MRHFAHYLVGGLALFLAGHYVGLPNVTVSATGAASHTPTNVVDRTHKGDRLMTVRTTQSPDVIMRPIIGTGTTRSPLETPHVTRERKLPIGCDPSFSPVAAPSLAHVTGRCLA